MPGRTKYHPAGYSSEYSAGRKFPSRIFGWTILLPMIQKVRNYGKKESYLTQWHTKGFQNIRLVSLYSKSVSHKNPKCLHFASVQLKYIVQKRPFFLSFQTEWKNESYLTQWHTKCFPNITLVSYYSKSVSRENSKCLHFASVQMKNIVQNRPFLLSFQTE